jgi:hypothetical protein
LGTTQFTPELIKYNRLLARQPPTPSRSAHFPHWIRGFEKWDPSSSDGSFLSLTVRGMLSWKRDLHNSIASESSK